MNEDDLQDLYVQDDNFREDFINLKNPKLLTILKCIGVLFLLTSLIIITFKMRSNIELFLLNLNKDSILSSMDKVSLVDLLSDDFENNILIKLENKDLVIGNDYFHKNHSQSDSLSNRFYFYNGDKFVKSSYSEFLMCVYDPSNTEVYNKGKKIVFKNDNYLDNGISYESVLVKFGDYVTLDRNYFLVYHSEKNVTNTYDIVTENEEIEVEDNKDLEESGTVDLYDSDIYNSIINEVNQLNNFSNNYSDYHYDKQPVIELIFNRSGLFENLDKTYWISLKGKEVTDTESVKGKSYKYGIKLNTNINRYYTEEEFEIDYYSVSDSIDKFLLEMLGNRN